MTIYRVALSMGGVVFVEADRHETVDGIIRFYRGATVHAEYARASVRELSEEYAMTHHAAVPRSSEEERRRASVTESKISHVLDMCHRFNRDFTLSEIVARVADERAELATEFSEIWGVLIKRKSIRVFMRGEPSTYICQ